MTAFRQAARRILAGRPGDLRPAKQVAERAVEACERFARHLSRLLGESAVSMLMKRSITLASVEVPWLHAAVAESGGEGHGGLSMVLGVMEHQEPEAITEAFIVLLSTFVDLLNRLIGDGLVDRLLAEVWPTVFAYVVEDPRE